MQIVNCGDARREGKMAEVNARASLPLQSQHPAYSAHLSISRSRSNQFLEAPNRSGPFDLGCVFRMNRDWERSFFRSLQNLDNCAVILHLQGGNWFWEVEFHRERPSRFHCLRCASIFDGGGVEAYVYQDFS